VAIVSDSAQRLSEGAKSLTEGVFDRLRDDILKCRLEPGARLRIAELCSRFGVSVHAVREALSRLASEALVVAEPQRGFKVAPASLVDLEDLTETRIEIEAIALRKSIANGSVAWESSLVAALHQVVRLPKFDPGVGYAVLEEWTAAHAAFHLALVSACNSRWLLWLHGILFDHSERYRRLSAPADRGERDTDGEHTAIVHAALDRDADLAVDLLTRHLSTTMGFVRLQSARGWPRDGLPPAVPLMSKLGNPPVIAPPPAARRPGKRK
jgi:DNA-binding GntR family transcriptional regulator